MNVTQAQQEIARLTEQINHHNHLYYVESNPEISDYDFDELLKQLQDLEVAFPQLASPNSPTKRVGGDITKKFESVTHRFPMLSLSNTYSEEEIVDWERGWVVGIEGWSDFVRRDLGLKMRIED